MVSVVLCLLDTVTLLDAVLRATQRYALVHYSNITLPDNLLGNEPVISPSQGIMPVWHYGRQKLCKDFEGQKKFYIAMKTKMCSLQLTFTANHVIELCRRKDSMLDTWVSALFDFDNDGYVNHYESTFYETD